LPAGAQAVQAAHAAITYALTYPVARDHTLVLLAADDELDLAFLCDCAYREGVPFTAFHEPDLGGSLTAVAMGDGKAARRLTAGYLLALGGGEHNEDHAS
jgi:hypothetical protein